MAGAAGPAATSEDGIGEANWVVSEEAELARDRREGYVLSREFFRGARLPTTVGVAGFGFLGWCVVRLATAYTYGFETVATLAVGVASLGLIPLARHWERRQEARRESDEEMRASFGHGGRFVSLLVRQGDAPTGEDRGMLWFEEGRMYFSGHRTSFGLVPAQVRGSTTVDAGLKRVRNEVNVSLSQVGPAGPVSLSFGLMVRRFDDPHFAAGRLKGEIELWKAARQKEDQGQWPPTTLGPGTVSEGALLARALARGFLVPILPAVLLRTLGNPISAVVAYAFGAVALSGTDRGGLLWRAWWAKRRFGRAVRQNRDP